MKLTQQQVDYLGEIIECDYIACKDYIEQYPQSDFTKEYKSKMRVANNLYIKLFGVSLKD